MSVRSRGSGPRLEGRERDRIWSEYMEMLASQHPTSRRLPGTKTIAVIILASVLASNLLLFGAQLVAIPRPWNIVLPFASTLGVVVVAVLLVTGAIGPRRSLWYAAMRKCGHDVCVICGYWLERRATDSRVCPECGTPDDAQPVALGRRSEVRSWPRFEVEPPPDPSARDDDDRR